MSSYAEIVKGSLEGAVTSLTSKIEALPRQDPHPQKTQSHHKEIVDIFEDHNDREKRKLNVVVYNLPEAEGSNYNERMMKDCDTLKKLVRAELNLDITVSRTFRPGKFVENSQRLMVASLATEEEKWDLLRAAPKLRFSKKYTKLYINPDKTRKEREADKVLRQELFQRKREGETNLVIRKGQIQQRPVSQVAISGTDTSRQPAHKPLPHTEVRTASTEVSVPATTSVEGAQRKHTHPAQARSGGSSN